MKIEDHWDEAMQFFGEEVQDGEWTSYAIVVNIGGQEYLAAYPDGEAITNMKDSLTEYLDNLAPEVLH